MTPVGIIGLGLMGTAFAERFLAAGLAVHGYDLDGARRRALEAIGGAAAQSPGEIFSRCPVVFLSLPTTDIVESVLEQCRPHLAAGTIIADTTTGDAERTAAVGAGMARLGLHYLDATVAGSSALVRAGQAVVMAGGDAAAFDRCEEYFRHFARQSFHLGPCGSGSAMKLVVNLLLGLNRAALAETLSFANRCGLEPNTVLDVLKAGPAYSRAMDAKGRKMIEQDFAPEAKLSQHLKDVRLILAAGRRHGAVLPLSALHEKLLQTAEAAGYGGADNSAVIKAFEEQPRNGHVT